MLHPRVNTYRDLTLILGSMFTVMGGLVVAPGIGHMGQHFSHVPNADLLVRFVVTIPSLAVALSSFLMGSLVDRFGRRPILLLSALGCGVAGSAGYFIESLNWILISRAFLGLSIAGLMTSVTTIVGDVYKGEERQAFLGWQSMAMNAGGIIFVGVGGALADVSWRLPFWIYSGSFVLFFGVLYFVKESGGRKHRQAQLQPGGTEQESASAKASVFLALAPIFGLVAFLGALFYTAPVQMAFVFEDIGLNATKVGVGLACMSLCSGLISTRFRVLVGKLGNLLLWAWIFGAMAVGYLVIGQATTFAGVTLGLAITGLGLGLYVPLSISLGMAAVTPRYLGVAIGAVTSAFFSGQFLAPFVAVPLLFYMRLQATFTSVGTLAGGIALTIVLLNTYSRMRNRPTKPHED